MMENVSYRDHQLGADVRFAPERAFRRLVNVIVAEGSSAAAARKIGSSVSTLNRWAESLRAHGYDVRAEVLRVRKLRRRAA